VVVGWDDHPDRDDTVRLFEYGGHEKLVYGEYDLPPLGERDGLAKNFAGSASRWAVKCRAGDLARYRLPGRPAFPLPRQLDREAAGEVIAAGSAATQFKPGDRVIDVTHPEKPVRPRRRVGTAIGRAISPSRVTRRSVSTRNISCATNPCGCRCAMVDYEAGRSFLRLLGGVMRLKGATVISSKQGNEPSPLAAADMIRLVLKALAIRGARRNDALTVLTLLGQDASGPTLPHASHWRGLARRMHRLRVSPT
jgi:hypothetical protein